MPDYKWNKFRNEPRWYIVHWQLPDNISVKVFAFGDGYIYRIDYGGYEIYPAPGQFWKRNDAAMRNAEKELLKLIVY